MLSKWKTCMLGEIAEIRNGKARPKEIGTIPVYGGNGILGYTNKFNINEEIVVIGRVGAYCGAVYYQNGPAWISDNALLASAKSGHSGKFLYYLLSSSNLNQYAGGSSHPLLTQGRLNDLSYKVPDLPTQTAIAEILSSLDDKVELNNQINQELEALAQALFKHWFIDFEFPNEDGKPYKSSGGQMVESELGEIPKGWNVSCLKDHIEATRGLSYKGSGLSEPGKGIPMINLNSVYEGGGYKWDGLKYYSGDYKNRHVIKPGEIAVTNTEQGHKYLLIGYPAIVPNEIGGFGLFSHHIYRVTTLASSPLTNQFIYHLIMQSSVREQIIGAANGTTVNMLKIDGLQTPKFVEPTPGVCESFSKISLDCWNLLQANQSESKDLSSLRDQLLPRLISGELQVN